MASASEDGNNTPFKTFINLNHCQNTQERNNMGGRGGQTLIFLQLCFF